MIRKIRSVSRIRGFLVSCSMNAGIKDVGQQMVQYVFHRPILVHHDLGVIRIKLSIVFMCNLIQRKTFNDFSNRLLSCVAALVPSSPSYLKCLDSCLATAFMVATGMIFLFMGDLRVLFLSVRCLSVRCLHSLVVWL